MAAGALVQIVSSYGPQDMYLSINPEVTYFKSVYKRHTNFSIETKPVEFETNPDFGKSCRLKISRYGDLISNMYLHIKTGAINQDYFDALKSSKEFIHRTDGACYCTECISEQYRDKIKYGWINSLGHALIKSMYIEIGGQKIDKQYGEWLEIWSELTITSAKRDAYYEMIGKVDPKAYSTDTFIGDMDLYVPLRFWFCKEYGLALPLISLQYHEIYFVVDFRKFSECWVYNINRVTEEPEVIEPFNYTISKLPEPKQPDFYANLLIDYVFLDLDERRKFITRSHSYLIEQIQLCENNEISGKNSNVPFYFNHPVKELLWVFQRIDVTKTRDWFNYGPFLDRTNCSVADMFDQGNIQINGTDLHGKLPAKYFRLITKYRHHTVVPDKYIYSFPFCIAPEKREPTGSLNFSRISESRLTFNSQHLKDVPCRLKIYALSYNVFIVTSGMGSTLFFS